MCKTMMAIFTLFCMNWVMMLNGNAMINTEKGNEIKMMEPPVYLYKILSFSHWNASQSRSDLTLSEDDDAFIHLSTEDQLEKIIEKFWPNVSQYVILKIKTELLEGKLVYEANPGGTNKYYHLYQGRIPLISIVEAKIIYNRPTEQPKSEKLDIAT